MKEEVAALTKRIKQGIYGAIKTSGAFVGGAIEAVEDSKAYQLVTDKLGINWLFNRIVSVDLTKTHKQVDKIRKKYPDATPAELADRLIKHKAHYIGTLGFATGAVPGLVPALVVDMIANVSVQTELIYEIALVYGMDLEDETRKGEVLTLIALGAGGTKLAESSLKVALEVYSRKLVPKLANTLLRPLSVLIGKKVVERYALRLVPVLGAITGAAINASVVTLVGKGAKSFYEHLSETMSVYEGEIPVELKGIFAKTALDEKKNERQNSVATIKAVIYFMKESNYTTSTIIDNIVTYFPEVKKDPHLNEVVNAEIKESSVNKDTLKETLTTSTASLFVVKSIMCANNVGRLTSSQKSLLKEFVDHFEIPFEGLS